MRRGNNNKELPSWVEDGRSRKQGITDAMKGTGKLQHETRDAGVGHAASSSPGRIKSEIAK